jgi:hypothetical protein
MERIKGKELGVSHWDTGRWYIKVQCPNCKEYRWVQERYFNKENFSSWCCACQAGKKGSDSHNWHGGKRHSVKGYIKIYVTPDSPFASMRHPDGSILEHRLMMAKHLGRPLKPEEIVHHKNGIKSDNRLDNLEINTLSTHMSFHAKKKELWKYSPIHLPPQVSSGGE